MKKKLFKRREQHGVRRIWYILAMLVLMILYFVGNNFYRLDWVAEAFAAIVAIITAVAFWLEYHEGKVLNQAQFAIDLNEQFIGSEKLSGIEWELEKFYIEYSKATSESEKERIEKAFEDKFKIENREHQDLVNYLVHLEGIAALVKTKVLSISTIINLMSYRYFIAMNNPIVQRMELKQYPEFYRGCIGIYNDWVNAMGESSEIPLYNECRLQIDTDK